MKAIIMMAQHNYREIGATAQDPAPFGVLLGAPILLLIIQFLFLLAPIRVTIRVNADYICLYFVSRIYERLLVCTYGKISSFEHVSKMLY